MYIFNIDADVMGARTAAEIKTRIADIDELITALQIAALKGMGTANIHEYRLHTGQSRQEVIYVDPLRISDTIQGLEMLRQRYVNKLTPRRFQLVSIR